MPMSAVETEDGLILMATGLNDVLVWDALDLQAHEAGIRGPQFAPTITVADAGDITGEYACFYRWIDRWGNISRPSPFSNVVNAVDIGTFTYTFATEAPPPFAARRQVLRNTAGQSSVYYVDIDSTDLSSSSVSSSADDETLSTRESQVIQDEDGITQWDRYYRPFNTMAILAYYNNRVYGAGYVTYSEGSVAVGNGSYNVVGTAMPGFSSDLVEPYLAGDADARIFTAPGSGRTYAITEVLTNDFPNWTFEVTGTSGAGPWSGPTQAFSNYAISPAPHLRNTVFYSEAGKPESWHPTNAFTLPEDGGEITALYVLNSFLFVAKGKRTYRFSSESDPIRDGFLWPSVGRGCVNHRTHVAVGEVVYVMDENGIYTFDGKVAQPVSTPIQDLFRGTNKHGYRINWRCSRYFHAVHCPADQCVRFFVTLQGAYLPRHALCYCYELNRWWIEEYHVGIGASCLGLSGQNSGTWAGGEQQVYLAGRNSKVYALGGSRLDAVDAWLPAYGGEVLDASFCRVVTVSPLGSETVGTPVTLTSGRGVGQTRLIVEVGADYFVVDRPFATIPDIGDTFAVGAITYRYLTHRLPLTQSEKQEELSIRLEFDPQEWGSVGVRQYIDHGDAQKLASRFQPSDDDGVTGDKDDIELRVDLTKESGYAVLHGDRHLEGNAEGARSVRVELLGASGPTPHTFSSIDIRGVG